MKKLFFISIFLFSSASLYAQLTLEQKLECGRDAVVEKFGDQLNGAKNLEAMGFPSNISEWIELSMESKALQEYSETHQSLVGQIAGGVDRVKTEASKEAGAPAKDADSPTGFEITDLYRVGLTNFDSPDGQKKYREAVRNVCSQIANRSGGIDFVDQCVDVFFKKSEAIDKFLNQYRSDSENYAAEIQSKKFEASLVWENFHKEDYNACAVSGNGNSRQHRFARNDVDNTAICWGLNYFLAANEMVLSGLLIDQEGRPRGKVLKMSVDGKSQTYYAPAIGPGQILNPAFANVYGGNAESWNQKVESVTGPLQVIPLF